jgi:hypothetical protein
LRNRIEHFDELLDKYFTEKPIAGHIFPEYVGMSPSEDGVPKHVFRAFYLDTGVFEVLGHRVEMQPLVDEIVDVYSRLGNSVE